MSLAPKPIVWSYAALALLTLAPEALREVASSRRPPTTTERPKDGPAVDFLTTSAIELSPGATVLVKNSAPEKVKVRFALALRTRDGKSLPADVSDEPTLDPGEVAVVPLGVVPSPAIAAWWDERLPASGSLRMTATFVAADKPTPTHRYRDVQMPQVRPAWPEVLVGLVGLPPAVLLVLYGASRMTRARADIPKIAPGWTPQSWSASLAIGGALLSSLLAVSALPAQTRYAARPSYTLLNVLFAALVALAPTVYGLLKAGGQPTAGSALVLFAVAAAITLWATTGQLAAAALLVLEMEAARLLALPFAVVTVVVLGAVALLVTVYAFRAVSAYVVAKPPAAAGAGGHAPPALPATLKPWGLI